MLRSHAAIATLTALVGACTAPLSGPASGEGSQPPETTTLAIRDSKGEDTGAHREIGLYEGDCSGGECGYCTATAVAPTVVLTAAHCVDYRTVEYPADDRPLFYVPDETGDAVADPLVSRQILEAVSYTTWNPLRDFALLRLDSPLPSFVRPAQLASEPPARGESVEGYGFGANGDGWNCARGDRLVFQKRVAHTTWPVYFEGYACGGDSGGPILDEDDRIAAMPALVDRFGYTTLPAPVPPMYDELTAQIVEWVELAGERVDEPEGEPASDDPCAGTTVGGQYCDYELGLDDDASYRHCSEGETIGGPWRCAHGCQPGVSPGEAECAPPPEQDTEPEDPCVNAAYGNGYYCARSLGGPEDDLLYCEDGVTISSETCADGCVVADPGYHDYCA